MQLSVVILNYNVSHFLELCLVSVLEAIKDLKAEVIVVDNASPDSSCDMVTQRFPEVTLIKNTDNVGFAKANNQGVEAATGEFVCILNPDTVVPESIFKTLLQFAEDKEDLGLVGCRLIDGNGQFLPESKRSVPTPIVSLKKFIGKSDAYYASSIGEYDVAPIEILVGAFMFVRKAVYQEVGGFDEQYFMYGEDIDLSYTVSQAGFTNYYYGQASVIHFKGESTLKNSVYAHRFYGAMQLFYKKYFKKNFLFDLVVGVGIKLIPLFAKKGTIDKEAAKEVIIIGAEANTILPFLEGLPGKTLNENELIIWLSRKEEHQPTIIVFDTNSISFQSMIEIMANHTSKRLYYRILPKKSDFILGSDHSEYRGEIKYLR